MGDEREGMGRRTPVAEAQALHPKKLCIEGEGARAKALGSVESRNMHVGKNKVEGNRATRVRYMLRYPTHLEGTRLWKERGTRRQPLPLQPDGGGAEGAQTGGSSRRRLALSGL